ncbi:female-specific protein transformer [Drosophila persimilis]|uniref:female-specific protein transformer n=1 Tax=Drosophila persimilis TaxID=7234 RepID=UPI000F0743C9|nr:female-specific protein transformer [Drosophila persimilis]
MDADSSVASHRDSHRSRTRRDVHVRDQGGERERVREQKTVPYFADPVRERDRVKNVRPKSPPSTGKRCRRTRSRSRSSDRRRYRRRTRSRSSERRHRNRSPRRRTPPPRIITVPVPVPAHEFAYGYGWPAPHPAHQFNGIYGPLAYPPRPRFGYRPMRPSFQAAPYSRPYAHHEYRHRHPFNPQSRFSYRNSWQHPN